MKKEVLYFDRIYVVEIRRGKSHPEWALFHSAVSERNGKTPDYGGINNTALIGTHVDGQTLHMLLTDGMNAASDVTVQEVTTRSLEGDHGRYLELVESYFLPYKTYRNISS